MKYVSLQARYDVESNGQYTTTITRETSITNETVARNSATQPIYFNGNTEKLEILEACIVTASGTRVPIDVSALPVKRLTHVKNFPPFSDERVVVVPFHGVTVGSQCVCRFRRQLWVPPFAGHFSTRSIIKPNSPLASATIELHAPIGMTFRLVANGLTLHSETKGQHMQYSWAYDGDNDRATTACDYKPSYLKISTFQSYIDIGRSYWSENESRLQASSLASIDTASMTAECSTTRDVVQKIHSWILGNIRHTRGLVANGNPAVRSPFSTLFSGYGDSKDHAALLVSLLVANDIESEMVLVSNDRLLAGTDIPTTEEFDHALVWIPELAFYVDPTFNSVLGRLEPTLYGRPALHLSSKASSPKELHRQSALERAP